MASKKRTKPSPKPRKLTSHKLVVYLYRRSRPHLEEGTVFLCDDRGKIIPHCEEHFDALEDIGACARKLLTAAAIKWP